MYLGVVAAEEQPLAAVVWLSSVVEPIAINPVSTILRGGLRIILTGLARRARPENSCSAMRNASSLVCTLDITLLYSRPASEVLLHQCFNDEPNSESASIGTAE